MRRWGETDYLEGMISGGIGGGLLTLLNIYDK